MCCMAETWCLKNGENGTSQRDKIFLGNQSYINNFKNKDVDRAREYNQREVFGLILRWDKLFLKHQSVIQMWDNI